MSTYRSPRAVILHPNNPSSPNSECRWRLLRIFLIVSGMGLCISTAMLHHMVVMMGDDPPDGEGGEGGMMHRLMDPALHSLTSRLPPLPPPLPPNQNQERNHTTDTIHHNIPPTPNHQNPNQNQPQPPKIPTLTELQAIPPLPRPPTPLRGTHTPPHLPPSLLPPTQRGAIRCDIDVDFLAYWNDPISPSDSTFSSPFTPPPAKQRTQYLMFEFDKGGWNNIRMSMEAIVVMARVTGRTLVLPPDTTLYLLRKEDENGRASRGFADFFPLNSPAFRQNGGLQVITFQEFLKREGKTEKMEFVSKEEKEAVDLAQGVCTMREKSDASCFKVFRYQRRVGYVINATEPGLDAVKTCFIFDEEVLNKSEGGRRVTLEDVGDAKRRKRIELFCGEKREVVFYTAEMRDKDVIHVPAYLNEYRFLNHFYTFLHFTDPVFDNRMKRYVRDFLHYTDEIYCAAGKIILALREEYKRTNPTMEGIEPDTEGAGGGYSSFHIRRGDFQFKKVKISAQEWYDNTRHLFESHPPDGPPRPTVPNEIMYIASDERNKNFFDPMAAHYPLRFLDDYHTLASLDSIDPNYLGMIDTIVASRGRLFIGTWFSTFTSYIGRMRGYHGMDVKEGMFYGTRDRMYAMGEEGGGGGGDCYFVPEGVNYPSREFRLGWDEIDGDGWGGGEEEVTVALEDEEREMGGGGRGEEEGVLGRGIAGLPWEKTPALVGARRGHIECDVDVDRLVYWNHPQGTRDRGFKTPFGGEETEEEKYLTFQPDKGGWNNIRMHLEIMFIFALATGRTLVLPPAIPLYLLNADKGEKHRGFGDFFPIHSDYFQDRIKIITMAEFVEKEITSKEDPALYRFPISDQVKERVESAAEACDKRAMSGISCDPLFEWLFSVGVVPEVNGRECLVFDEDKFHFGEMPAETEERLNKFCSWSEKPHFFFNKTMQDAPLIHFSSQAKKYRIMAHFYGIVYFTDPKLDNFFKRFVRDFMHYHDAIYCAAGKIVLSLQNDGQSRGFELDSNLGGGFSSIHVRRGDLQYKKVKISAEAWIETLNDTWKEKEIIYIATDERNKTFFDPIAKLHDIRFLDDYWDMAGLGDLDPNYMGMIDTIVASRGRVFAGTFFSTFSGYINRMRGYHGMSMKNSHYGWSPRKYITHYWDGNNRGHAFSYEWPAGWIGIDGDEFPTNKTY